MEKPTHPSKKKIPRGKEKEEDLVLDPKRAVDEGKEKELEEQREVLGMKPSEAKKHPQEERTVSW